MIETMLPDCERHNMLDYDAHGLVRRCLQNAVGSFDDLDSSSGTVAQLPGFRAITLGRWR